jgi:hypothetical protein
MAMLDLLWVQRMLLEKQLRCTTGHDPFLTLTREVLEDVNMMTREVEESVMYAMHWSRSRWEIDFAAAEKQRLASRTDNHPCNLIQPFIQAAT